MIKKLYFFFFLIVFFLSCKKETETFEIKGKEYISEAIGRVRTYKIDSIYFSENADFGKDTTITFYQRHVTQAVYKDSVGEPYFYHQIFNSYNNIDWFVVGSFKTYVDTLRYIKQINNLKVIHLALPIASTTIWDGNLLNSLRGRDKFRYIETDDLLKPDSIYPNQITVRLKKEILPVTESFANFESYAPNIGMVYKYEFYQDVQLDNNTSVLKISGWHVHYNLIDFR